VYSNYLANATTSAKHRSTLAANSYAHLTAAKSATFTFDGRRIALDAKSGNPVGGLRSLVDIK
jgi:hypothetical protein